MNRDGYAPYNRPESRPSKFETALQKETLDMSRDGRDGFKRRRRAILALFEVYCPRLSEIRQRRSNNFELAVHVKPGEPIFAVNMENARIV